MFSKAINAFAIPLVIQKSHGLRWSSRFLLSLIKKCLNSYSLLLFVKLLVPMSVPVFDATAKPPSGILSGNGNQYGDFDECLDIDGAVRGKYCLASLQVTIKGDEKLEHLDTLIHSGHYLRSNVTDVSKLMNEYCILNTEYWNDI